MAIVACWQDMDTAVVEPSCSLAYRKKPESSLAVQWECSIGCSAGGVCEAHKQKPGKADYILLYF